MKGMVKVFLLVAYALLAACEKTDSVPQGGIPDSGVMESHDGRFGSECNARSGMQTRKFCSISIYQLLGNLEQYDGQYVQFVGYAGMLNGKLYVFPSESALERMDISSGIELRGSKDTLGWVLVFGRFSARLNYRAEQMLGWIEDPRIDRR